MLTNSLQIIYQHNNAFRHFRAFQYLKLYIISLSSISGYHFKQLSVYLTFTYNLLLLIFYRLRDQMLIIIIIISKVKLIFSERSPERNIMWLRYFSSIGPITSIFDNSEYFFFYYFLILGGVLDERDYPSAVFWIRHEWINICLIKLHRTVLEISDWSYVVLTYKFKMIFPHLWYIFICQSSQNRLATLL